MKNYHLTNEEKALMFTGSDNWHTFSAPEKGLRGVSMSDGPHGLRIEVKTGLGFNESKPAVCWPTASALGCTFDRQLIREIGEKLSEECHSENIDLLLGPGINHKRSPLCGRNFEYFSEDPYLSSELGTAYVKGLQENGTGACVKHYACNSREKSRLVQDSIIDERTLHEIYLRQFDRVIRQSEPVSIMAAYNRLNGKYCCENEELLNHARDEGFNGVFISDWGAVSDPVDSLKAGLNLQMPGGDHGTGKRLLKAVDEGRLDQQKLDENADRMCAFSEDFADHEASSFDTEEHLEKCLQAALESCVLLKNDGVLPIKNPSIAVIGELAVHPRFQGTGSSKVNSITNDNLYDELISAGYDAVYEQGYHLDDHLIHPELIANAVSLARKKEVVIVAAGLPEGDEAEGYDRTTLSLPRVQNLLIEELVRVNSNVVVILQAGAPVTMPWKDDAGAVMMAYLSGCRSGQALVRLLNGTVSPSGKLAETFPEKLEDTPCFRYYADSILQTQYRECIFTGYRYYDTFDIPVLFPFGFGLTYSTFEYSGMTLKEEENQVLVTLTVTNTGKAKAREIVEIYVSLPKSKIARAKKELAGFESVMLEPGESRKITIPVLKEDIKYYDVNAHKRLLEEGTYLIQAASSVNDVRLHAEIDLEGTAEPVSPFKIEFMTWKSGIAHVEDETYEKILGCPLPKERLPLPITKDTTLDELKATRIGRLVHMGIQHYLKRTQMKDVRDSTVFEAPLRMSLMAGSRLTWDTVDELAEILNGRLHRIFRVRRTLTRRKNKGK